MGARRYVLLCYFFLTNGLTLHRHKNHNIVSKTKVELTPQFTSCRLNDIVIISTPIINAKHMHYYLTTPNGNVIKLKPNQQTNTSNKFMNVGDIVLKNVKGAKAFIKPIEQIQIFSTKHENFTKREDEMGANDFALGPLTEEDHGNWILSVYYKDINYDWIEMFQVISIEILEIVPAESKNTVIEEGSAFKPSFADPIKGLESCELIAPSSTFDRLYDRSQSDFQNCGYVVQNVTKNDEGIWTIIGIGKIVYETQLILTVLSKII